MRLFIVWYVYRGHQSRREITVYSRLETETRDETRDDTNNIHGDVAKRVSTLYVSTVVYSPLAFDSYCTYFRPLPISSARSKYYYL
jgi:hypothetical protein